MSWLKRILISLGVIAALAIVAGIWFIMSLFEDPDLSSAPAYYPFKSEKAKQSYLSYYDDRARDWPVDSDTITVQTSWGSTFIRVSGPEAAPALVLLPSTSSTSLIWSTNIEALSEEYRVYALDNIYDVGRSVNTKNIQGSEDMVAWLDELFTKLELGNDINIMGLSFGGWLTSQYLILHPERLDKAILIAPVATIIQIPGEWAWRAFISVLPHRYFMKRFMVDWLFADMVRLNTDVSNALIDQLVEDGLMNFKSFTFRMPVTPTVLTDNELHEIRVPTLFLVGENEKLYPAGDAIERFNSLASQIKTQMILNAGHDLTIIQADTVNQMVLDFLAR